MWRCGQHNSVHKCPETASKGRFRRSVYTIASPRAARAGLAPQLSAQQCTQMAQNGVERPFSPICVHYCIPTGRPRESRVATVYTNAPERRRKAAFANLCTLLRPPASPRGARVIPAPQQCTQMPQNGVKRPFSPICVHYCVTTGRPRDPRVATVYTNAPKRLREAVFGDLCTLLRPPASPPGRPRNPRVATVYTNAPERLRRAVFGDLCTLLRPPASPRDARATLASQQCTQMPQNSAERPLSPICVHYCVPLRHHGPPASPRPPVSQQCTQSRSP